ncbi:MULTISPECIES: hypothetical protein [Brenneria]|uniref:hypothetical protein n=1 Tax=Brenneria TaxID=71655 RepID=UPI0012EAF244|nr:MULTISPECIES: hypothetical protein [Brenneria]
MNSQKLGFLFVACLAGCATDKSFLPGVTLLALRRAMTDSDEKEHDFCYAK